MNELIYQPLFNEQGKMYGHFIKLDMFGLSGLIFRFDNPKLPRKWRNELIGGIFTDLFTYILMKDEFGKVPPTLQQKYIREDKEWFQYEWQCDLDRHNLYVYSHMPTKPGGYVRVLTEPDPNEDVEFRLEEQKSYPKDIGNAGPVEKFLYSYGESGASLFFGLPLRIKKSVADLDQYCWKIGDELELDPDISYLYFNDTVEWDELYWDLFFAIGRVWKGSDYLEAWRTKGNETEKKLIAEHDAQRLLFWCMENDYTLDDLRQMVAEKRVLTKRFPGTKQDSWMTLQYGL